MRAPTGLGRGDALHAMHAALPAQDVIRARAPNLQHCVLDPARLGLLARHHVRRPRGCGTPQSRRRRRRRRPYRVPLARVRQPGVHPEEVAEEQRGLGAPDARPELDERGEVRGGRRAREEQVRKDGGEVVLEGVLQLVVFFLREMAHVGVGIVQERYDVLKRLGGWIVSLRN